MTRGPGMYVSNEHIADMFSQVFGMRDRQTERKKFNAIRPCLAIQFLISALQFNDSPLRSSPLLPCRNFRFVTGCPPPFGIMLILYRATPSLSSLPPAIRLSHLTVLSFSQGHFYDGSPARPWYSL
jgi:hypothetical protein